MTASINVASRNRAIKKLLEGIYGPGIARVTGERGSAYGWVNIQFTRKPELLSHLCPSYTDLKASIEALCKEAGIELFSYCGDMPGEKHTCLSISFPREEG